MHISFTITSYDGMGGHPAISFVGEFSLLEWSGRFAESFEEIDIYAHVPSRTYAPNLSALVDRFRSHAETLPKASMKRKLRRIDISYNSRLGYEEGLLGDARLPLSVETFDVACRETVEAWRLLPPRLKPNDDFDCEGLIEHAMQRLAKIPATEAELRDVLDFLKAEERKRRVE